MTILPVHIEHNSALAGWLGVDELVLVREDKLPDQGGKKRRALMHFANENKQVEHLHLLSYAGSHTAFTLSRLMPQTVIHLYGTQYGGGDYERRMTDILDAQGNIIQRTGSNLMMSVAFQREKMKKRQGHLAMKIGGSLGVDLETGAAVDHFLDTVGKDYHHVVAVASGDLLSTIYGRTEQVTGVLTQPFAIRLWKSISLPGAQGLFKASLAKRIDAIREISGIIHETWDPIFMGSVMTFLRSRKTLPRKLCIWVTCPSGISWMTPEDK